MGAAAPNVGFSIGPDPGVKYQCYSETGCKEGKRMVDGFSFYPRRTTKMACQAISYYSERTKSICNSDYVQRDAI